MKTNLYLYLIFGSVLINCQSNTLKTNDIALELVRLENNGAIAQSDKKESFFRYLDDVYLKFEIYGYGHRISEMNSTWNLYEDKGYLIMTGSVAENDQDIYVFTLLFKDEGDGVFDIVYEAIGDIKEGVYPKDIIPFDY